MATSFSSAAGSTNVPYEVVCSSKDRPVWLKARRTGIGASEIAAVLGETSWGSPTSVYADKVCEDADDEQTEPQFWGSELESTIAKVYAERAKRQVRMHGLLLRSKEHPWALATLDCETSGTGVLWWPGEIKTCSAYVADDWKDGPPNAYYHQAQQQLLVTGAKQVTVACLIGGQRLVWCDVMRDEVAIRRIIYHGERFWTNHVEAKEPPPADGSDATKDALSTLYPKPDGGSVVLEHEFDALFDERLELKATARSIKKRVDAIDNKFRAAIGNHEFGIMRAERTVGWSERRGQIDYRKCAEAHAQTEVLEKYRKKATRVLKFSAADEEE